MYSEYISYQIFDSNKNFSKILTSAVDVKSNTNPFPYGKVANSVWMIAAYIACCRRKAYIPCKRTCMEAF